MEMHTTLFSIFLVLVIIFFLNFIFFKKKHENLPPGSSGWPLFGESLEFLSTGWKGHPEKFIFDRISKFSSDIFKTHLFGSPFVVFCGATNHKFLFSNENKLVKVWCPSSFEKLFPSSAYVSKVGAINLRKMLPNFLKPEALQRYVGIMDNIIQQHFDANWKNKDIVTVHHLTKRCTFRVACRLFINIDDLDHVAKFSDPFSLLAEGIFSMPIDLPGTPFNRAIKASKFIKQEFGAIIKQRKMNLAEGKVSATQDILSHMLLTSDEDGNFMPEEEIANRILGLLIGGHDTLSSVCSFIVNYLAELPHIYEGVYKEQMEIASKKSPGELLDWDDLKNMKYSWNVVCEAMRLAPAMPGAFREAITNFMHNGFKIPKGCKIYWSANSTHKNPDYFPEPLTFDPSRFEGSGPAPYTFVPFGGGPRMCPGKEYARMEILIFMHHLVRRFKWEKVIPDEKIVVNPMPNPEKGLPIRLFPYKA